MDFPAEAAASNRQHRIDRMRSKKMCRRSAQFSGGKCLYHVFLGRVFFSSLVKLNNFFVILLVYIAAAGPLPTLPFDKEYIEALKGVHSLFLITKGNNYPSCSAH